MSMCITADFIRSLCVFFPRQSPDNASLEALGRKISSFNGYVSHIFVQLLVSSSAFLTFCLQKKLWAGGQPDFLYPVSGDSSDWIYAALGVASFGLEVGKKFYESCTTFENQILPDNLPALVYATKVSSKPNSLGKGPDIIELAANINGGTLTVTASASDSQLVNIDGYPAFETGSQTVSSMYFSLGVHPDDANEDMVEMARKGNGFEGTLSLSEISPGKHILYAQAKDSDGYLGPVSSMFVTVSGGGGGVPSPSSPTPSPNTSQWTEIANETFISSLGIFSKIGRRVRRLAKAMERQGVVRIKKGSLHAKVDGSYSKLNVSFSAFFPAASDKICLEHKPAGVWERVKCWTGNLGEGKWHDDISEEISMTGKAYLSIRLSCNGRKRVFVDNVAISGKS